MKFETVHAFYIYFYIVKYTPIKSLAHSPTPLKAHLVGMDIQCHEGKRKCFQWETHSHPINLIKEGTFVNSNNNTPGYRQICEDHIKTNLTCAFGIHLVHITVITRMER